MATISARVDDRLKAEAESVADAIGLPLSTAVNIFLRRFVAEGGFPFSVTVSANSDAVKRAEKGKFDKDDLEYRMKASVLEANIQSSIQPSNHFSYIDPTTKQPVTVYRKE